MFIIYQRLFPKLKHAGDLTAEMVLLLGALERVDNEKRILLGNLLLEQISGNRQDFVEQKMWSLTRIAVRVPLYGGSNAVIPVNFVELWILTEIDLFNNERVASDGSLS